MTQTTALATPGTPANLADKLKDKIRIDLAELMEEDQWTGLLEAAIKDFIHPRTVHHGYNNRDSRTEDSHLTSIVREILTEVTKEKVREILGSEGWVEHWDNGKNEVGVEIKKFLKENSTEILQGMLHSSFQSVLQNIQTEIQNSRGY